MHGKLETERIRSAVRRAQRQGAESALQVLLAASQKEVPRDTGALAASGRVEMTGDGSGRVVYDRPYALLQHERTDFMHRGGKAKYLEDPANNPQVQAQMEKAAGEELIRVLGP